MQGRVRHWVPGDRSGPSENGTKNQLLNYLAPRCV